jgi:excisionase family DNA binding protein
MDDKNKLLTVPETAVILKVSEESVRRFIRRGDLKAAKVGQSLRISIRDLEAYYRQNGGGAAFLDPEPEAATK